jgi:hypothetical protein
MKLQEFNVKSVRNTEAARMRWKEYNSALGEVRTAYSAS